VKGWKDGDTPAPASCPFLRDCPDHNRAGYIPFQAGSRGGYNVAETSLTIPGIRYVVDTGLARISQYLSRQGPPVFPIQSHFPQQCRPEKGPLRPGCQRTLHPALFRRDYDARPAFTPPEILRSNLAEVILRMIYLNLGNPCLPFVDKPGLEVSRTALTFSGNWGPLCGRQKG